MLNIHANAAHPDSALTEIALALAMGFFAILVLMTLSMGAHRTVPAHSVADTVSVRPSETAEADSATDMALTFEIIIYFGGRFLNSELVEVDPTRLKQAPGFILAIDPSLSLADVVAVQAEFAHTDVVVTALTEPWVSRLKKVAQ